VGAEIEKKCILLVEDDPTISDLLAYNLRRAGYEVLQEHNGRSGLQTALANNVDLVLMDLMLPGLDGMAASRDHQAKARTSHHHAHRSQRARDHPRGLRPGR
jgi:DNA-binding response OmpR family regulator